MVVAVASMVADRIVHGRPAAIEQIADPEVRPLPRLHDLYLSRAFQRFDAQLRELRLRGVLDLLELGNRNELVEDAEPAGNEIGPAGGKEEFGLEDANLLDELLE